jgi:hypothetical protein
MARPGSWTTAVLAAVMQAAVKREGILPALGRVLEAV